MSEYRVYVCHGPSCRSAGSLALAATLETQLVALGLQERCELIVSGCQGRCEDGPNITVYPRLTKYAALTPAAARRIACEHLAGGRPVLEYLYDDR